MKGKKKSKRRGLEYLAAPTKPSSVSPDVKPTETQLDKWGLPAIPSEDEIFPALPHGTELLPIDPQHEYSLHEMEGFLQHNVDLRLDNHFDENGIEKNIQDGRPMKLKLLHCSPPVLQIRDFFIPLQCDELKGAIENGHKVESATFQGAISTRTSTSWFCNFIDVPLLLAKASSCLNIPLETMEEPQIVRYRKGEEFSWHYDEVPPPQLLNGGQRVATILIYLNDIIKDGGGGTMFRDLKTSTSSSSMLTMQPQAGSALIFFPADKQGRPDDRTLHRSDAMRCDEEKWIIQMWVHERSYDASLPIGNSNRQAEGAMTKTIAKLGFADT